MPARFPGVRSRAKEMSMKFLQTVVGVILAAAMIYLAFIVGTFLLKVLLGLVAIGLVILVLMRLFGGGRRGERRAVQRH